MLRNREIRWLAVFCLAAGLAAVLAGFAIAPAAGVLALALWGFLCAGYGVFTAWRYRQISILTAYLARVYGGGRVLDIRDNTEGELSLLKNDLYKITVALQQQADQLQADKRFLADALGDISHQLKTPLTSALVMTDLLADASLPEQRRREFTDRLSRQLGRIQWLVGALLKLSRLDAGAVAFRKETVPVEQLLRRALDPLQIQMELQNVQCQCDCPAGIVWQGDESCTVQAVQNVVKNCVEQMPNGGCLTIQVTDDPLCCRISISDTGGGIDPEDLPHLFERFYRGSNAGPDSVGIGLALAQGILRAQDGNLTAENIPGGARFVVELNRTNV